MTANELRDKFNDEFGLNKYPETYEVDHETYANVCQFVFDWAMGKFSEDGSDILITIGPKKQGIMFRGVELILKEK